MHGVRCAAHFEFSRRRTPSGGYRGVCRCHGSAHGLGAVASPPDSAGARRPHRRNSARRPPEASADATIIDGRSRYLIPGLTDFHIHFYGYSQAGAGDRKLEPQVLLLLLANGVTTAVNMEGSPPILALRDELARGTVLGPKLYTTGPFIQMPDQVLPGRKGLRTPEEVTKEVLEEKRLGYDFVKVHGDLPAETYRALVESARQQGIRVVGHVPSNLGVDAALAGHQALIVHAEEYLYSYFQFHRDLPGDPAEIDRMVREVAARTKQAGTWVSPTLSVFRQIIFQVADIDALLARPEMRYLPADSVADWHPPNNPYVRRWPLEKIPYFRTQYSIMQKLTGGLRDAGVPLLVGTDNFVPCQIAGFAMKDEMEQMFSAGLTRFEVLQAATANPAVFRKEPDAGTAAPGKIADLVLLDANPLDDVDNIFRQDGV
ncbi:MAG TPA: amidohydrolase family protein, partial [Candidatus Binataceae bacterium]|nr:amidohydrolase family protein [Candidatus Binataceae bacterium]